MLQNSIFQNCEHVITKDAGDTSPIPSILQDAQLVGELGSIWSSGKNGVAGTIIDIH